ncbi:MAG TPA: ATP-binding protein [Bacteroidales bacterium]|nr:ATP-binding protein [Bacteroidales bacterium]
MERYLRKLISEGENQQLDFKYCISDSKKIARTLSAFANTDGGKLLIGVRDNGSIAGVRSDEEYYMIETASGLFCRPEIPVRIRQHIAEGKTVLEVDVEKGEDRPYEAKDDDGKWKAYFRKGDQNLLANSVLIQLWKKKERDTGVLIRFGKPEKMLMEFLKKNGSITISAFRKLARIPSFRAEKILVNLIICDIIDIDASEKGIRYVLNQKGPAIKPVAGSI